jgi:L-iditol 2-dehydrogenase
MKTEALVLTGPRQIEIIEIDVPAPGPGQLLVEVKANGICRGDIALYTGEMSYGYPFFHGHEPVGIIADIGPDVDDLKPGDTVACMGSPSYRTHIVTSADQAVKIPDGADLPLWISEPPTCAVNGVQGSEFRIGDSVALLGCGYMGLLVLQSMPREIFRRLVVFDPDPTRLALARSLSNVTESYDPLATDFEAFAKEKGEFDVVVEASGVTGTLKPATALCGVGGILNIFGWHPGEETVPTHAWHYKGLRVYNSSPMMSRDYAACFRGAIELMKLGRIDQKDLITHRHPYTEAAEALEIATSKTDGYIKGVLTF